MNRWAKIAVAVLLGVSLGMQWTVLQSVAWTTMLVSRTGEAGFVEAVRTTFDGRHPCSICRVVEHGKDAQKKQETRFTLKKIDATISETPAAPVLLETSVPQFLLVCESAPGRGEPPPLPPPRPV